MNFSKITTRLGMALVSGLLAAPLVGATLAAGHTVSSLTHGPGKTVDDVTVSAATSSQAWRQPGDEPSCPFGTGYYPGTGRCEPLGQPLPLPTL